MADSVEKLVRETRSTKTQLPSRFALTDRMPHAARVSLVWRKFSRRWRPGVRSILELLIGRNLESTAPDLGFFNRIGRLQWFVEGSATLSVVGGRTRRQLSMTGKQARPAGLV